MGDIDDAEPGRLRWGQKLRGGSPVAGRDELAAWQALRERYGNRDESRVDQGRLLPPAV